jgi:hypothetical protein
VNRLVSRVIRLERIGGRNGWRAYAGVDMAYWPDDALLGFLAEGEGWPADYIPTDAELRAITGAVDEDEGAP